MPPGSTLRRPLASPLRSLDVNALHSRGAGRSRQSGKSRIMHDGLAKLSGPKAPPPHLTGGISALMAATAEQTPVQPFHSASAATPFFTPDRPDSARRQAENGGAPIDLFRGVSPPAVDGASSAPGSPPPPGSFVPHPDIDEREPAAGGGGGGSPPPPAVGGRVLQPASAEELLWRTLSQFATAGAAARLPHTQAHLHRAQQHTSCCCVVCVLVARVVCHLISIRCGASPIKPGVRRVSLDVAEVTASPAAPGPHPVALAAAVPAVPARTWSTAAAAAEGQASMQPTTSDDPFGTMVAADAPSAPDEVATPVPLPAHSECCGTPITQEERFINPNGTRGLLLPN